MRPASRYPVLQTLFSPFHSHQRKTLSLVIAAIVEASCSRSFDIAARIAEWTGVQFDSALNRFYRLLRNRRINDHDLSKALLGLLSIWGNGRLLISIDWTEWHDNMRILAAAVVVGKRAIPVQSQAFEKDKMRRSQNTWENNFLRLLAMVLRELGCEAMILCDRGFRRVSWIRLLQEQRLGFTVRLMDDIHVCFARGDSRALGDLGLKPGKVLDLGVCKLRKDAAINVRVVGVWAPGAKEAWWLACSSADASVQEIVAFYDRRMTIEEQFRDTKGQRFGVELYWTHFRNPRHLARLMLLVGFAVTIWITLGVAITALRPDLRMPHPTKGPRRSYVTIGLQHREWALRWRTLNFKAVCDLLPIPALRLPDWIPKARGVRLPRLARAG